MRARARRWAVLGLTGAVALTACGGDEEPTSGLDETLSESDGQTDDATSAASSTPTDAATSRLATPRPTPSVVPAPTADDRPTTVASDVPRAWLTAAEDAALAAAEDDTEGATGLTPSVTGAVSVVWPDGSLGCPEPGVNYTQAPVEGARVIVEVGGESFDVRLGERGNARVCATGGLGGLPTS